MIESEIEYCSDSGQSGEPSAHSTSSSDRSPSLDVTEETDEYFTKDKRPRDSWVWLHASKVITYFYFYFLDGSLFGYMI